MSTEQNECIREVDNFLKSYSGHVLDVCYAIYKILKNYLNYAPSGLRFFLTRYEDLDSDYSQPVDAVFKIADVEVFENEYGEVINAFINERARNKTPESLFYPNLWDEIENRDIFKSDEEKAFAIYLSLSNPRIPYFLLDEGLQMSDEAYGKILRENLDSIQTIRFISATRFDQKTKRASLLLNVLDSIPDIQSRIVVFTSIIKYITLTNTLIDDENIE